jgi:predicted phage tail protein
MSSKKSKQPAQVIPVEAPNSLISNSRIKFLDLIGEGELDGFVVKSGAYGSDPLVSTYFDEIPVRNLDGSYNINASGQGFNFAYTLGTTGQSPILGFEKVENIIPLTANTESPIGSGK